MGVYYFIKRVIVGQYEREKNLKYLFYENCQIKCTEIGGYLPTNDRERLTCWILDFFRNFKIFELLIF